MNTAHPLFSLLALLGRLCLALAMGLVYVSATGITLTLALFLGLLLKQWLNALT